ncbi:hypothetical protein [Gordonia sp. NPDC003429]
MHRVVTVGVLGSSALLGLAALLGGCASNDQVYVAPSTSLVVPAAATLVGEVSAIGPDDLAVDAGLARPVSVRLAAIVPVVCAGGPAPAAAHSDLSAALSRTVAVGTPVVVARVAGRDPNGDVLTGYVFPRAPRSTDPSGPSINEQLLRAGEAQVQPPVRHGGDAPPVDKQVASAVADMPQPGRTLYPRLVAAESDAWSAKRGPIGGCARHQQVLDDQAAASRAAAATTTPTTAPTSTPRPPSSTPTNEPVPTREHPILTRICKRIDMC